VSETVWEKKRLFPNVDFFAAPLLHTLGIPVDLFTPVFATSRVAGWTAHVMEQYKNNRLLRPLSNYVGSAHRSYVPLEDRFPKASDPDGCDAPQAVVEYAGGRGL
jgi:citrate synthase